MALKSALLSAFICAVVNAEICEGDIPVTIEAMANPLNLNNLNGYYFSIASRTQSFKVATHFRRHNRSP